MKARSRHQRWSVSDLINTEENSLYGGKLYGTFIVLIFISDMLEQSSNKTGKIRIRCDNIIGILGSFQTALKSLKTLGQYYKQSKIILLCY